MSDPQPTHLDKKPPRAEPLQPDRPGSGDEQTESSDRTRPAEETTKKEVDDAAEQAETARKNVTQGYD